MHRIPNAASPGRADPAGVRSSHQRVPQRFANFGIGTLATLEPVRIAHLSIPAKMKGSQTGGTMLFRIYSSSAGGVPGPYGVSVHAPANMERKVRIDPAGNRHRGRVRGSSSRRTAIPSSCKFSMRAARPRPTRRKQSSIRRPSRNSTASTDPSSPRTWFAARQPTGCRKSCSKPSVRRSRRCSTARSN